MKNESGIIAQSNLFSDGHKTAYLNFNLDPNKYYVFRISISMKNGRNTLILFGILNESLKDS